jgi:hypothetical protein
VDALPSLPCCSGGLLDVEHVQRYMKGGQGAPSLQRMAPFLQLIRWCQQHTHCSGVSSRCLPGRLPCIARMPNSCVVECRFTVPLRACLPALLPPSACLQLRQEVKGSESRFMVRLPLCTAPAAQPPAPLLPPPCCYRRRLQGGQLGGAAVAAALPACLRSQPPVPARRRSVCA